MVENVQNSYFGDIEHSSLQELISVLTGMKQTAFILRINISDRQTDCLFRFEDGIMLTLDSRVPKPQELYRDVAFHNIDNILGWNITAPVKLWKFDNHKGVIRPYYKDVKHFDSYQINNNSDFRDFFLKTAILDYICGVVDRNSNDILIVDGKPVLVDSGLSFVEGVSFYSQISQIRKKFIDTIIPNNLIQDLQAFNKDDASWNVSQLLNKKQIQDVKTRVDNLLAKRIII